MDGRRTTGPASGLTGPEWRRRIRHPLLAPVFGSLLDLPFTPVPVLKSTPRELYSIPLTLDRRYLLILLAKMTRYTNFARKRTYVDAGFDHANTNEEIAAAPTLEAPDNNASSSEPKKRKRVRSKKTTFEDSNAENPGGREGGEGRAERPNKRSRMGDKHNSGKKFEKRPPKGACIPRVLSVTYSYRRSDSDWRKHASEQRRLRRIDDRNADTVCFACREKGHTARDCTNTLAADAPEGEQRRVKSGRDAVGICYRYVPTSERGRRF